MTHTGSGCLLPRPSYSLLSGLCVKFNLTFLKLQSYLRIISSITYEISSFEKNTFSNSKSLSLGQSKIIVYNNLSGLDLTNTKYQQCQSHKKEFALIHNLSRDSRAKEISTYTSPSILCSGVLWKDFCGCPILIARVRRRSTVAAPPLRPPMAMARVVH